MKNITQALRAALAIPATLQLTDETRLGQLPGWDSMNAINVQMEIEAAVGQQELPLKLTDKTTLAELAAQLKQLNLEP